MRLRIQQIMTSFWGMMKKGLALLLSFEELKHLGYKMVQFTFECGQVYAWLRIGTYVHWFGIRIDFNMYLAMRIHP